MNINNFSSNMNHVNDTKISIYPTPLFGQDMTQGQFLSGV